MQGDRAHHVLVVDDDLRVLRAAENLLREYGFDVTPVDGGDAAVAALRESSFDVVLSDIQMPGMDGIDFLRTVRELDLDIPVLLMTGDPSLTTAMNAVDNGAFGYVVKPFDVDQLEQKIRRAAALHALAKLKRQALEMSGIGIMGVGDLTSLESRFASALRGLWMAFQPIVDWNARRTVSYESLVRTDESTLARPDDLLAVAEKLGRVHDLGRAIRGHIAAAMAHSPADVSIYVNLHPSDLSDAELFGDNCPLHEFASRVVLEITERASLSGIDDVMGRIHRLRVRGYRIAVDDLGAGYAGLSCFTQLEPDIVKLDMSLVRDVDRDSSKRHIVRAMVRLCHQLGIAVVGEGVETVQERDTIDQLGCAWLQGYLFARPGRNFPQPVW